MMVDWLMKISVIRYCVLGLITVLTVAIGASLALGAPKADQTYFLVAQPDLPDPMFRNSVVLMLPPTGTPLVIGLIINKPTKLKLSQLFSDASGMKNRPDTAFFGGPVDVGSPLVVIQTDHAPSNAVPLFKGIYLSMEAHSMAALVKDSAGPQSVRLYLGRAQWTDDQLHDEMLENSWYNVPSDPGFVFSADPDTVWRTLVARAQAIQVSAPPLRGMDSSPMLLPITWPSRPTAGLDERP
jgi:putative transcriptional regulator